MRKRKLIVICANCHGTGRYYEPGRGRVRCWLCRGKGGWGRERHAK